MKETLRFIKFVIRMWNILNIKSIDIAKLLNDAIDDARFDFLLEMTEKFKQMDSSSQGQCVKGFTSETGNALHRTLIDLLS